MAKKSMIAREVKRKATVKRYAAKRAKYRRVIRDLGSTDEVYLRKDNLLLNANAVVPLPVERLSTQAPEVADARDRNINQAIQEFIHPFPSQGDFATNRIACPDLEGRDANSGVTDYGLLPRDTLQIIHRVFQYLSVQQSLTNTHVQGYLADPRDRHRIRELQSLHNLRHGVSLIIFLEPTHLSYPVLRCWI